MARKLPENPNKLIDYTNYTVKSIYLAGGCFWGVDAYIRRVKGVSFTQSGYANGHTEDPTYEEVCSGFTGYTETVRVDYSPELISLPELLERFFSVINPTSFNRQGNDVGSQYRSGVYWVNEEDEPVIENFISRLQEKYTKKILTENKSLSSFYPAENYHQDYLEKNPNGYCHIDLYS